MAHHAFIVLMLIGLAACSGPERIDLVSNATPNTDERKISIATTRQPDGDRDFSSKRNPQLNYARYDVSIPPVHQSGQIEWPQRIPNPATDFI